MSFTPARDGRARTMDYCTISVQSTRAHGHLFVIRMRHTVADRLRWARGTMLTLHVGEGSDAGKVRLKSGRRYARALHRETARKYQPGEAPYFIRFKPPMPVGATQRAERCAWRIPANDPDALEIDLPRWAR